MIPLRGLLGGTSMRDLVNEWVQEGRLWIWQYANARRGWQGWHFAADPAGCRSIRDLLDRMNDGQESHRSLKLEPVSEPLLQGIGYDRKCSHQYDKLKLQFLPLADDLSLHPVGDKLELTVGNRQLPKLAAAFSDVEAGGGDFGIAASGDKRSETWVFWWPPQSSLVRRLRMK